jgi:hypothetical protein
MNDPRTPFAHGGDHALCDPSGAALPHLTPSEQALHRIAEAIERDAADLSPEQIEAVVVALKQWKFAGIAARDLPDRLDVDRRSKRRHRDRHPIRRLLRRGVVAIQAKMLGRAERPVGETPDLVAFRDDMEGIQDRYALTRLEGRAYAWSWVARVMSMGVFGMLGVLAFLYASDGIHWTTRAAVMLAALGAFYASDKCMLDAFRLYARRERHYFLACIRKAAGREQLVAAGLCAHAPVRGTRDPCVSDALATAELRTLADKLYRK